MASLYRGGLADAPVSIPPELDAGHVHHLFPIRTTARDALRGHLRTHAIDTLVHYPVPLPAQPAFAPVDPASFPITAAVCDELLSLPLYPGLKDAAVRHVVDALLTSAPTSAGDL